MMDRAAMIAVDAAALDAVLSRLERMEQKIDQLADPPPDWLSIKDYADHIGRSTKTVRNWIASGKVKAETRGAVRGIKID